MKKTLLFLVILGSVFFSCDTEEINELFLDVSPSDVQIIANSEEVVTFVVDANSDKELKNILITSRENNTVVYDTLLNQNISGKSYKSSYLYKTDVLESDTTLLFLTFKVTENDGNSKSVAKRLINIRKNKILTEKSGNIFYSHKEVASLEDAYNLEDTRAEFSNLASLENLQIVDDTLSNNTDELSKSWISLSGGQFRRDNGIDYVNATRQTLVSSCESGQAKDKITNIHGDNP